MTKTKRQPSRLKPTGSLAKPLLPYDGRLYPTERWPIPGILGAYSGFAARYKREQQLAKLPDVVAALGLDMADDDLAIKLLIALCERLFPTGFKEDPRGRHKEDPERKNDAAFKMVHHYQMEIMARLGSMPTIEASAEKLEGKMEKVRKNPDGGGVGGPALRAAIQEALAAKVTSAHNNIKRKAHASLEKSKRERVGIEAYHLELNNALYPLDGIARHLGALLVIAVVDSAKPNGVNALGLPLRKPTWGRAVVDRLTVGGCHCVYRDKALLIPEAETQLAAALARHPKQSLIIARSDSRERAEMLAGAFKKAGVSLSVLMDGADALTRGADLILVLLEDNAPPELVNFYDPAAPKPGLGLLFGLGLAQLEGMYPPFWKRESAEITP